MEFKINKKREYKKFTFPCSTKQFLNSSCSCFILSEDHKIIFATRSRSFYCSYLYIALKKGSLIETQIPKIISCIKNLHLVEFLDLITNMHYQEIFDLKNHFSLKEISILLEVKAGYKNSIFKDIKFKDLLNDELFKTELRSIIQCFRKWYFENEVFKELQLDSGLTIVLPGGKKEDGENCREAVIREVMEEICLDIDINEVSILNKDLEFVNFKDNKKITPVFDCYTKDKILNYVYNDKVFIFKIDKTYKDIIKNFKPTTEITSVFPMSIKIDYDNVSLESLKNILKTYRNSS